MVATPDLIELLAGDATPVRPLRPPWLRALLWLGFAGVALGALVAFYGPRHDLAVRLADGAYLAQILAATATGITAALAAFMVSLPDRSRFWQFLPLPAVALWLLTFGWGCLRDWVSAGPDGLRIGVSWPCLQVIALSSVPLGLTLVVLLRHAALIRPHATATLAGLAVAALASAALSLFHHLDAAASILVWHLGSVLLVTAAVRLLGPRLLVLAQRAVVAS